MRPGLPAPLVELLGARWSMGAPVAGLAWFDDAAVGFGLADGTVAVARARWDGAAVLRPREGGGIELTPCAGSPPPVMRVGVHDGPSIQIAAAGRGRVVSAGADGRLAAIGSGGDVATLASVPGSRIGHVAAAPDGTWAYAVDRTVRRSGSDPGELAMQAPVAALAFDPAGRRLAIAQPDGVSIWPAGAASAAAWRKPGLHRTLAWSPDGTLVVSGLAEGGVHGWRQPDGTDVVMGDTAAAPSSLSFSPAGGFLAASGSARVACWHFGPGAAEARQSPCGVGSSVAVTQVACHPTRLVIAAGYENGAVLLCQPDSADIVFVRAAGGGGIEALAWSPDGEVLAYGAAGGEVGLVSCPGLLFRTPPPDASRTSERGTQDA